MEITIMGEFRIEKFDRKQYFVFHLINNNSDEYPMHSGDTDNNYLSASTMFLCPDTRIDSVLERNSIPLWTKNTRVEINCSLAKYLSNDRYKKERLDYNTDHYVFPLFWCKNKEDHCKYRHDLASFVCQGDYNDGSDYYFCEKCDKIYHKECVESPLEIKHPSHPNHPLKLFYISEYDNCVDCKKKKKNLIYHCTQCNLSIDPMCALKPIPLVIDRPKRHEHPLKFFTRKTSLDCNVCGLVREMCSTYICVDCDFVAHQDCYDSPTVIRISRHKHRISFTSSLPYGEWSCGVCRKKVDNEYGAYTCKKCDGYVVHSRCALREDIWDGKELEGIPDEDDIEEMDDPFEKIGDGLILHFLHKQHALKLETSGEKYDDSKICDACAIPIYEGDFYKCKECDFILHGKCANAPRKIRHPLHPHPLTLKVTSESNNRGYFKCNACYEKSSGFIYECNEKENCFRLDVRCGSISEPFDYKGHEHPLFLALDPQEKHSCQVCQSGNNILINCIECDFIICLECINLPYMVRYTHDKHFLTLEHWKETDEPDWCEICEKSLSDYFFRNDERFYQCKQCCTTLHTYCLLGRPQYLKPGHTICGDIQILLNNSLSRPHCFKCRSRCVNKIIYKTRNYIACCLLHVDHFDPFL